MNKNKLQLLILGIQHLFAMIGACLLVPILTGLNPLVALFGAGVGTLIFHFITKGKVPVFLGSSFAFIAAIQYIGQKQGLEYATGGIVIAGFMYVMLSLIIKLIGTEKIVELFPPIVTGSIIIVIGLTLAPTVIQNNIINAEVSTLGIRWLVALITLSIVIVINIFAKGFLKSCAILCGIIGGYILSASLGLIDFTPMHESQWFTVPNFMIPKFSWQAIAMIAPISLVTFLEHICDITTNGTIVGQNFIKNPGLHRTLLGDGLATMFAGFIGAPANTTYSENTGVLAITKNYNPKILRITAVFAIIISFISKFGTILQTIPSPVIGGVSIILFGMIASIGIKTLAENNINFNNNKNLIIISVILVIGLSGIVLPIQNIEFSSLAIASVLGVILNKILTTKN